jgi:hypothetical protein
MIILMACASAYFPGLAGEAEKSTISEITRCHLLMTCAAETRDHAQVCKQDREKEAKLLI